MEILYTQNQPKPTTKLFKPCLNSTFLFLLHILNKHDIPITTLTHTMNSIIGLIQLVWKQQKRWILSACNGKPIVATQRDGEEKPVTITEIQNSALSFDKPAYLPITVAMNVNDSPPRDYNPEWLGREEGSVWNLVLSIAPVSCALFWHL